MASKGDQVAKVAVLFIAAAALNALRRGELGDWAKAKFFNADAPPPAGQVTLASLISGQAIGNSTSGAGAAIAGGAADAATTATSTLIQVGNTKMSARFAAKWRPLVAAAAADGVLLTGNAWRSNARQIELRIAHGCGGSKIHDSSCKGNPPTAVPGRSRHETGDAIDLILSSGGGRTSPEYIWMSKNAGRYGIYNLPSEPWHWSIDGS